MQTQPSMDKGPEQILKKLETRESSPAQMAQEALRQGDQRVAELKTQIDDLIDDLGWDPAQKQTVLQLEMLKQELGQARTDLGNDLHVVDTSEIDQSWGAESPVTQISTAETQENDIDPWGLALEESDKAFASGVCSPKFIELMATQDGEDAFRQNLNDATSKLFGETTDFKSLNVLCSLSEQHPRMAEMIANEMADGIGEKYWTRLKKDENFRSELEAIQKDLGGKKIGDRGLCPELGLAKLLLLHEMFGKEPGRLATDVDLATYCPELKTNYGEMQISTHLDKESGLISGDISLGYKYGNQPDDARMHRVFSSVPVKTEEGYALEKSTTLELITLPDRVKSNNTARQEMTTTNKSLKEQGFSREKLHANIDIGGYAWAAMGFGWDTEKMRREDQKNKSDSEIVIEFVNEQLSTLEKKLSDSGIDPNSPDIKAILETLKNRVQNSVSGALITPQDLACLGKGGPTFVKAESGNYYRTEDYPNFEKNDPPLKSVKGPQHLGKMLLIGSDWYGQKPL